MTKVAAVMNPGFGVFSNVESIPMLNGSNYSEWKKHLLLVLALMDLDISLREERPDPLKCIDQTEHWDRSNRMSLMIMEIRIPEKYRGIVPEDVTTAKDYLAAVEKCYAKRSYSETAKVLAEYHSTKNADENVREYIMRKMSVAAKLKKLGMHIPDDTVADLILDSLPSEFDQFKQIHRFNQKIMSTHELIAYCVQLEETSELDKKEQILAAAGRVVCGKKRKNYYRRND